MGPENVRRWVPVLLAALQVTVGGSVDAGDHYFKQLGMERVTPPRQAHDFALSSLEGKTVRLSELRGKVVFLNFWATWCPACREEMPSMEWLHTGVGHYFPTYVTPKVFLRMDFVDAQGRQVKGSLREAVIGREATLDLSRELFVETLRDYLGR